MLEVVDVFCGAGGLSLGLRQAGLRLRAGVDRSAACVETYRYNLPRAEGVRADLAALTRGDLVRHVLSPDRMVLAGCPPCRLFSQLHRVRRPLGQEFKDYLRLLWSVRPAYVVFENVPRIVDRPDAWLALTDRLRRAGYYFDHKVVTADHFGVPQRRRRMVLVAARTPIELPDPPRLALVTVRDAIGHLPAEPGGIPNHVTMGLSPCNRARIRRTGRNGGRSKPSRVPFDDSYGRMEWGRQSPTITTRCVSFSNGRFGHPEFDRAITVREAAILQGFPDDFVFVGGIKETARQVGNAVPPPIARWLGGVILAHYRNRSPVRPAGQTPKRPPRPRH